MHVSPPLFFSCSCPQLKGGDSVDVGGRELDNQPVQHLYDISTLHQPLTSLPVSDFTDNERVDNLHFNEPKSLSFCCCLFSDLSHN